MSKEKKGEVSFVVGDNGDSTDSVDPSEVFADDHHEEKDSVSSLVNSPSKENTAEPKLK
jgi:hypothetical protein